ncbi:CRISPR-associated helicase Cas3' [Corynebacterium sp. S7]
MTTLNRTPVEELSKSTIARASDTFLQNCSNASKSLWAKTGEDEQCMSLPQHIADSLCAAAYIWEDWVSGSVKGTLSRLTGLDVGEVQRLYLFLAGCHDLGKSTPDFEAMARKIPGQGHLAAAVEDAGLSLRYANEKGAEEWLPHGKSSGYLLWEGLKGKGISLRLVNSLASVVEAHHGISSSVAWKKLGSGFSRLGKEWKSVHADLFNGVSTATGVDQVLTVLEEKERDLNADSLQLLTGLVVMADWIASNTKAFPLQVEGGQAERLRCAVEEIKLTGPWAHRVEIEDINQFYRQSFGWHESFKVRPVQEVAVRVARRIAEPGVPSLTVIEAPTGEGKTEAGLAIAQILGSACGAQGLFFAAPTMSTANGLYDRTSRWASRAAQGESVSSMYLAHSKNQLFRQFRELRFSEIGQDEDEYGSVIASQWMSGSKKGLLSNFAVGTVDQVLMLALQMRHSMLRHVALAGKVIIIDEAHAYDAYMSAYLETALSWLARYGVSVIIMSATLPPTQRKNLVAAFAKELPGVESLNEVEKVKSAQGYPLVTSVSSNGIRYEVATARPSDLVASIKIIDDDLSTLSHKVEELLTEGGIALVICNTVRRAQEAYAALTNIFPGETQLHHSAFIASDRSAKEDELRRVLGPRAHRGEDRPERLIVVATQVAEQSLDIDADVLITDIAPMDLIIQRAGRLHRHSRPEEDRPGSLQVPQILLRGILQEHPVPVFDSGAEAVYDAAILMATFHHLPQRFRRPDDIENLVRHTYELVEQQGPVPMEWEDGWAAALASNREKRDDAESRAKDFRIPEPSQAEHLSSLFKRISGGGTDISGEERGIAQVRDAEPNVEVIAIQRSDYGYRPFGLSDEADLQDSTDSDLSYKQALRLAGSTVRLPAWVTRRETDFEEVISALERCTPTTWRNSSLLRGRVALDFDSAGDAEIGRFLLHYSPELGLTVEVKN